MARRDVSWIKPGVRVWLAENLCVLDGIVRGDEWRGGASPLFSFVDDPKHRAGRWKKNAYATEAEACHAAHTACIRRANSLERQAAEMRAKASAYMDQARKAVKRGKA